MKRFHYWITFEDLDREDDFIDTADGYLILKDEVIFYSVEKGIIKKYPLREVLTVITVERVRY